MTSDLLIHLVKQEAQLATVCTEPAMIALAAAKAVRLAGGVPLHIHVYLSPGTMKNTLTVGLPLTARRGPEVAAALGAVGGKPDRGLQVLGDMVEDDVALAHGMLDAKRVNVTCCVKASGVYAKVRVETAENVAEVTMEGSHGMVSSHTLNGQIGSSQGELCIPPSPEYIPVSELTKLSFDEIIGAVMMAPDAELQSVMEHSDSALRLAVYALEGGCPEVLLGMDRTLGDMMSIRTGPDDEWLISVIPRVRVFVAAAVSARMGGVPWPILTSSGSGDQGIVVSIPILLATEQLGVSGAQRARALFLAHAISLYIKAFAGCVSALCGAVCAGAGVAAAICWLLGGERLQMEGAVQTVLGSLYGMLCDGAKSSCAYKCAAAAGDGMTAGYMASKDVMLRGRQGVIGNTLEETAAMIRLMAHEVFSRADLLVLRNWRPDAFPESG